MRSRTGRPRELREELREKRIVVHGPLPPTTNNLYFTARDGKRRLGARGREYKKKLHEALFLAEARKKAPEPPFALSFYVRLPSEAKSDLSNKIKAAEDALMEFLGEDDRDVINLHVFKYVDPDDIGMTVVLEHSERDIYAGEKAKKEDG